MDPLTILLWLLIILVGGTIALYVLGLLVWLIAAPFVAIAHRRTSRRARQTFRAGRF